MTIQNCSKYLELNPVDRARFIGELIHCCQSDNFLYEAGLEIIELGKMKGLMDGVKILPSNDETLKTNSNDN